MPARELATDIPRLDRALAQLADELGTERRDICAVRLIELWTWLVAAPAAHALLSGGPLPDASPVATRLLLEGSSSEWTAELGNAVPMAEVEILIARLRSSLAEQLEPLVETLNGMTGRPRRALWRSAADRLAGAILWTADDLGRPQIAGELARRAVSMPPLRGRARTALVQLPDGAKHRLQLRDGCCLYYRVPGGEHCASCPLVHEGERGQRLAAELAG